jgi:hypothetical protein
MNPVSASSLLELPRKLYRRTMERRTAREERRFRTRLRLDPQAPELLLSPHWDDAVLDCFALLASERELKVVNIFAGVPEPGRVTVWDAITGASDSCQRARERIAEDARALARVKRAPLNPALLDAQYRHDPLTLELAELDDALREHLEAASWVYVPAGIGAHVDHVLVRRYGRMLHRSGIPVTLYAELPYCILHGWPHWVDGRDPEPHRNVDAYWASFLGGVEELPPLRSASVQRLDDEQAAAKLSAMRCYETQFACLNYGARTLLSDPAIHRFEVHWELEAPRTQS